MLDDLEGLEHEAQAAERGVLDFERGVAHRINGGQEVPETMVLSGLHHYHRHLLAQQRLLHAVQMRALEQVMEMLEEG